MFKNIKITACNAFFSDKNVHRVSACNPVVDFIATGGNLTWFMKFDQENKSKLHVVHTLVEEAQTKFVCELRDVTYKITDEGSLYQLLSSWTNSSGDCFFSGSSGTSSFSWRHITNLGGNVISAVGICDCLAYVVFESGQSFLKVATLISTQFVSKSCHQIGSSPENVFLKTVSSRNLSIPFLKHWLAEQVILDPELIILAQPTGLVSVLPVGPHIPAQTPIPIHYDNGEVVFADAVQEGLILVYSCSKVVMISYCKKLARMKYDTFYLSAKVKVVALAIENETFRIIWSDGDLVRFTKPLVLEKIDVAEGFMPLRGIVDIFSMDDRLVYFSINGLFYETMLSSFNEVPVPPFNPSNVLNDITKVGGFVESMKHKVSDLNSHIEALVDRQIDPSKLPLRVEGDLSVENVSDRSFSKEVWSVMVQSMHEEKFHVKIYSLDEDLAPLSDVPFSLDYFIDHGCKVISVALVGMLTLNERRIILKLKDNENIKSNPGYSASECVRQELLRLFEAI